MFSAPATHNVGVGLMILGGPASSETLVADRIVQGFSANGVSASPP